MGNNSEVTLTEKKRLLHACASGGQKEDNSNGPNPLKIFALFLKSATNMTYLRNNTPLTGTSKVTGQGENVLNHDVILKCLN